MDLKPGWRGWGRGFANTLQAVPRAQGLILKAWESLEGSDWNHVAQVRGTWRTTWLSSAEADGGAGPHGDGCPGEGGGRGTNGLGEPLQCAQASGRGLDMGTPFR